MTAVSGLMPVACSCLSTASASFRSSPSFRCAASAAAGMFLVSGSAALPRLPQMPQADCRGSHDRRMTLRPTCIQRRLGLLEARGCAQRLDCHLVH